MLINKINNAPVNTQKSNSSFKGKLILRGKWTPVLENGILEHAERKKLETITGDYDIVARMRSKKLFLGDRNHTSDVQVYKLYISSQKQNSFKDKLLNFFGLKSSILLSSNWHNEYGMKCSIADRFGAENIKNLLDL